MDRDHTFPLEGAKVEVMNANTGLFGQDSVIGTGHTGPQGVFSINGHFDGGDPNVYVRVWLSDEPQKVLLHNEISNVSIYHTRADVQYSAQGNVAVGDWAIGDGTDAASVQCIVWDSAHRAYADYVSLMGNNPPAGVYHIQHYTLWDTGTPWTDIGTTHWPVHYPVHVPKAAGNTAFHEFGHSVRHAADGDRQHFDGDALAYHYGVWGWCDSGLDSEGNAFNEGWAAFWDWALSGDGALTAGCAQDGSMGRDGNVARALRRLSECRMRSGGTAGRRRLVDVLLQSRGLIHSYVAFEQQFTQLFGNDVLSCDPPPPPPPPEATIPAGLVPLNDKSLQNGMVAKAVTELDAVLAGLNVQLIQSQALPAPPCLTQDCAGALARALAPIHLQAEIDASTLARQRVRKEIDVVRPASAPAHLSEFRALPLFRRFDEEQSSYDRAVAEVRVDRLREAIEAIEPLTALSPEAEQLAQELESRLSALEAYVSVNGAAPPGLQPSTSPACLSVLHIPVMGCSPDVECLPLPKPH
jgi:hypothetical protein